jgi:hypothetical protein
LRDSVVTEHNRLVRTRARRRLGALVVLIASSFAAGALADLESSATAMACCAKAKYRCAGLRSPDDCCQQMGHTARPTVAGTLSPPDGPKVAAAAIGAAFGVDFAAFVSLTLPPALKRPHDPPHLHHFNPLI